MNNMHPLVNSNDVLFRPQQDPMEAQGNDAVDENFNKENESLNTFRDVRGAEKEDDKNSELGKEIASAFQENSSASSAGDDETTVSDARCKELFGSGDLVKAIADINAYRFRYKPGAQNIDPDATPDKEHVGIMAQELQSNPVTATAVVKDPLSGYLKIDTSELSTTMMAILTQMAKKIEKLEQAIKTTPA